jgi:hypothetical protein
VTSGADKSITEYAYKDNPIFMDYAIHTPQDEHFEYLYDLLVNLNSKKVLLNLKSSNPTISIICKMYLNHPTQLDIKQSDPVHYSN